MASTKISDTKFDILVNKIFKFLTYQAKLQLKKLFDNNDMLRMSELITSEMNRLTIMKNPGRQDFIIDNIYEYLYNKNLLKNNVKIVDIGGGDGTILEGLRYKISQSFSTAKTDFICVENPDNWTEEYKFNKLDITYQFTDKHGIWDVENGEALDETDATIRENSVDIVFCMVSLHHMNQDTLMKTFDNIRKMLKPNGKLFIKEHDVKNNDVRNCILWEHHLYHMLDCGYNGQIMNVRKYLETSILEPRSKLDWQLMLAEHDMKLIDRKNRFLNGELKYDVKNVTELYWDMYAKYSR